MKVFLIVDDEVDVCLAMVSRVRGIVGNEDKVLNAFSADQALKIIEDELVDCLITDIRMQGKTGLELIETAQKRCPHLKTIVVTAYDDFEYARQSIRLKVADFLLKPFSRQALKDAIGRAFESDELPETNDNLKKRVEWATTYARKHISEAVSMEEIAEKLNLSYAYFSRAFKNEVGCTFSEYMQRLKMEEAKYCLAKGYNVSETADKLGYSSVYVFSRAFSRCVGMSPVQWLSKSNIDKDLHNN